MNAPIAVIDIGTNSTLMLIGEINPSDDLKTIAQFAETTRLGRDIQHTGIIGRQGFNDTIRTLRHYQSIAIEMDVKHIIVVGTQVFRLATNRNKIVKGILEKTGLSIEVLSKNQEAEFSFRGAISGKRVTDAIVVDIGGGSTEMIRGSNDGIQDMISLPLGAVVMTDQFLKMDPPDLKSSKALKNHVIDQIPQIWKRHLNETPELICVGGTATTLAALHLQLETYDADQVNGLTLTPCNIQSQLDRFCKCPLKERRKLISLDPERADIIIAGTLILQTIVELTATDHIKISDRGLRHGIALRETGLFNS